MDPSIVWNEQAFLGGLLLCLLGFFMWGRWRYDLVAFVALLIATLAGTVPVDEAFLGFGHPATVTVALVLIIGRALINSGAFSLVARHRVDGRTHWRPFRGGRIAVDGHE